jgi:hypothetical protein
MSAHGDALIPELAVGLWASLRSRPAELDNPGWGYPLRTRRRGSHDAMRARIRRSGCGLANGLANKTLRDGETKG